MKTLDRWILYVGVWLAVILAAVGVCNLRQIKRLLPGHHGGGGGPNHALNGGAIQIIPAADAANSCEVDTGYLELPALASGTVVQWQAQVKNNGQFPTYYVQFQQGQSPFDAGPDHILVQNGKPSGNTISDDAQNNCSTYNQCVFPYFVSTDQAGNSSCFKGGTGTAGIVIKCTGGGC